MNIVNGAKYLVENGGFDKKPPAEAQTAKIQFKKFFLTKDQDAPQSLRGSIAITQDNDHIGWLHKVIYGFQKMDVGFNKKKRKYANPNLCHTEMVLGVVEEGEKKGHLILGHAMDKGVVKTTEYHREDEVITGINFYTPTDEKVRGLFARFAEQTTTNLAEEGLNTKKYSQEEIGQYSTKKLIGSVFHKQKVHPSKKHRKHLAFAVADLLKGDKFKNSKGEQKSFYCTSYVMTLTQAAVIVAALEDAEIEELKGLSRDQIAEAILNRISKKNDNDPVSARYWANDFMKVDARYTMTYFAGTVLDRNLTFVNRVG